MRIHSDILTGRDILAAASLAGPDVMVDHMRKGSRSRSHAYDVSLTGTSSRRPNNRGAWMGDDAHAATWDEWGMFLAELFRRDPDAIVPGVYESAAHYRWATDGRFDALTPPYQHGGAGHHWELEGTAVTGAYSVHACKTCDARRRVVAYGRTWAQIDGEA